MDRVYLKQIDTKFVDALIVFYLVICNGTLKCIIQNIHRDVGKILDFCKYMLFDPNIDL